MNKNVLVGLFALIGVVLGIFLLGAVLLLLVYGWGWSLGWLSNLVLKLDIIILGVNFEQLIGLMSIFSTMIASSVVSLMKLNDKKVNKVISEKIDDTMKDYRGY